MQLGISGLSDVTAIAGGANHTLALKSDGTVWAWGSNFHGQLGDGSNTDRTTPVQVSGLSDVTAIAGGGDHAIALKSDGTVWAWGFNFYGQLGDGSNTDRTTPVQVSGLSDVTAIAGGYEHTIALESNGTVWTWGLNDHGQLGDGTTTIRTTPLPVSGLRGVTTIAGGYEHTIALKSDGTVWAWGYNLYGELGDSTTTQRTTPVQVSNLILKPAIPTATTTATIDVTFSSATLNGRVNPNDASTTVWFEYGTTSGVYSYSTTTTTVSGMSNTTICIDVDGLSSGTTYYYRIVAQNSEGTSYGDEMSFITDKGSISGFVIGIRGYPIEAKIRLKGSNSRVLKKTFSAYEDGYFEFTDLDADTYIITALKSGYKMVKQTITLEGGEDVEIEIVMKKMGRKRTVKDL